MTTLELGSSLPTTPPADQIDAAFLNGLRDLIANSGTNKHDQATNMIIACIGEGIDTGAAIRRVGMALGFNAKHMGIMLATGIDERRWQRDAAGRYSLTS